MLRQNLCAEAYGLFRPDAAVGPHFQRQFVVVGHLTDTRILHAVIDAGDRRVDRIDRDDADRLILPLVAIRRNITAAAIGEDAHMQSGTVGQCRNVKIRV